MGRVDEAVAEINLAQEIDPISIECHVFLAPTLFFARRYDQTIEQANKTLELFPNFWLSHTTIGRVAVARGNFNAAIKQFEQAYKIDQDNPEVLMELARAYAFVGKRGEAEKIISQLNELARRDYVSPYHFALCYFALLDKERGYDYLEKAYQARSWYLTALKQNPQFDDLRQDARFIDLSKRLQFP